MLYEVAVDDEGVYVSELEADGETVSDLDGLRVLESDNVSNCEGVFVLESDNVSDCEGVFVLESDTVSDCEGVRVSDRAIDDIGLCDSDADTPAIGE